MGAGTKRILTEATGIKLLRALEIINDGSATTGAATTADESRILTDATGDALVDELDDLLTTLKGNLGSTRNGVAVTIEGNKASVNVTSGQYVIVQNSTISSITDGAYKAKANVSAGTSFTSSNLEAVSGGVANSLSDQIANMFRKKIHTGTYSGTGVAGGSYIDITLNHAITVSGYDLISVSKLESDNTDAKFIAFPLSNTDMNSTIRCVNVGDSTQYLGTVYFDLLYVKNT